MVAKATAPRRENVPRHILFHSRLFPGMELYQDEEKEEIKRGNDQKG